MSGTQNLLDAEFTFIFLVCLWIQKMREEPCMHRLVIRTRMRLETHIGFYAKLLLKLSNRNEDLNGWTIFS